MCEFPRSCKFYAHNIRKCIGYKFYCIFGKTVTQCPMIASLYLPVCAQVSYDSIASLILTFLGTPLEFPLKVE